MERKINTAKQPREEAPVTYLTPCKVLERRPRCLGGTALFFIKLSILLFSCNGNVDRFIQFVTYFGGYVGVCVCV